MDASRKRMISKLTNINIAKKVQKLTNINIVKHSLYFDELDINSRESFVQLEGEMIQIKIA
jgi:hypothetical protein